MYHLLRNTSENPSQHQDQPTQRGFLPKIKQQLSKGNFPFCCLRSRSGDSVPNTQRTTFRVPSVQGVDENSMVIFASTLGTASVSIPDMPCSATTAPSQAGLVGAGAVYSVKNSTRTGRAMVGVHLGLGLHLGSETSSGSETGSAHTGGAYAYGDSQRRRTNVHTPIGAVDRVLPPLAAVPTFSSPTLQLSRGCGRIKSFMRKCNPFCICICFCFCIPIEDE